MPPSVQQTAWPSHPYLACAPLSAERSALPSALSVVPSIHPSPVCAARFSLQALLQSSQILLLMEEHFRLLLGTMCSMNECCPVPEKYFYSHHAHDRHTLAYCREPGVCVIGCSPKCPQRPFYRLGYVRLCQPLHHCLYVKYTWLYFSVNIKHKYTNITQTCFNVRGNLKHTTLSATNVFGYPVFLLMSRDVIFCSRKGFARFNGIQKFTTIDIFS